MTKKPFMLIIQITAVVAMSLVIVGGAVLGWMATNDTVTGGVVGISVLDMGDNNLEVESFNGGKVPDSNHKIYPHDIFELGLNALENVKTFNVIMENTKLKSTEFAGWFTTRNDLTSGDYKKAIPIDGGGNEIIDEFDIDKFLEGKSITGGDAARSKTEFLEKFADSSNLLETLSVSVTKIISGGVTYDFQPLEMIGSISDNTVIYRLGKISETETELLASGLIKTSDTAVDGYFDITGVAIPVDSKVYLSIEYGTNGYQPTMTYGAGDGVFDAGTYYAENYNCFTYQTLAIGATGEKG